MANSIEFPGTSGNRYEYAINNNQDLDGATTILMVVRVLAANGSWQSFLESENSGGTNQISMGRQGGSDQLYYSDTAAVKTITTIGVLASQSWQVLAVTRPAGAGQTIRGHQIILGGATTHGDSGSTGSNNVNYATGSFIVAGDDDPANIRVAAWAIWNTTALSDGDVNGVASALTTQSILDLSPVACYDSENGLLLTDLVQSMDGSLVGAITESSDGPSGWVYFGDAPGGDIPPRQSRLMRSRGISW